MSTVTLRAVRPVMVYGRRVERGGRVELPPVDALDAVQGSTALDFVDHSDRERCMQARRDQIARQLRRVPPDPGSPWQPSRRG